MPQADRYRERRWFFPVIFAIIPMDQFGQFWHTFWYNMFLPNYWRVVEKARLMRRRR